jgi:hypothetical protein
MGDIGGRTQVVGETPYQRKSNMTFSLTSEQLEFLGPRLRQDKVEVRFESVEACQHEDRRRAAALREIDEGLLSTFLGDNDDEWLFERDSDELATLLDQIAAPNRRLPAPPCLASSLYLRDRRIGVFGAVLELLAAHPELDRAWFTGRHPTLSFRANGRGSQVIAEAQSRLQHHLKLCF